MRREIAELKNHENGVVSRTPSKNRGRIRNTVEGVEFLPSCRRAFLECGRFWAVFLRSGFIALQKCNVCVYLF